MNNTTETVSVSKYDAAVIAMLNATFNEEFTTTDDGVTFVSEHKELQVLEISDIGSFMREMASDNSNPMPSTEKIEEAKENARTFLIDYDIDDNGNRYSQFVALVNLNGDGLLTYNN